MNIEAKGDFGTSFLGKVALWFGERASGYPKVTLISVSILTVVFGFGMRHLEYDDDILKFLPEKSQQVSEFQEIGKRFQGLSIALVGIEAEDGDLFTAKRMSLLRDLTEELKGVRGVAFTTSITTIQDVSMEPDGAGATMTVVKGLIDKIPAQNSPQSMDILSHLKAKALSRSHVAGALLSHDARGALILAYLEEGVQQKDVADAIRRVAVQEVKEAGEEIRLHFGGTPFVGSYIVHATRRDLLRLSLISGAAIVFILVLTARSLVGSCIALMAVAYGILWVLGLMGFLGYDLTLVSSSLPMLLLALGSAYSIHLLVRVLAHLDNGEERVDAVRQSVQEVGPPIFIAGLTSALAFFSFVAMDIEPMRAFGIWMCVGTLVTMILALTMVPAAACLFPMGMQGEGRSPAWAIRLLVRLARWVVGRPVLCTLCLVGLVIGCFVHLNPGKTHMTMRDFFLEGSEPVAAEDFLEDYLGGSVYMQIQISGDIKSPMALRQIEKLSTFLEKQPGVTGVQSVFEPMVLAGQALRGVATLPLNSEVVRAIGTLAEDEPNLRVLVDKDWRHTLLHVKVHRENVDDALNLRTVLAQPEMSRLLDARVMLARSGLSEKEKAWEVWEVLEHLRWLYAGEQWPNTLQETLRTLIGKEIVLDATQLSDTVLSVMRAVIEDDELIYLREGVGPEDFDDRISAAKKTRFFNKEEVYGILVGVASAEDLTDKAAFSAAVMSVVERLNEALSLKRAALRLKEVTTLLGVTTDERLERVVWGLEEMNVSLPEAVAQSRVLSRTAALELAVTGTPLVYEGMNQSVQQNQINSLSISAGLVFLALAFFFRSIIMALLASVPAVLTLFITFALMGYLGIPMDVGTSMMTSIALGIGIDYAVHFVWHYRHPAHHESESALDASMRVTGWGIVVNALEVSIGFGLLVLGAIVPMRHVGMLTATAMIVSALATLLLIPALMEWFKPMLLRKRAV